MAEHCPLCGLLHLSDSRLITIVATGFNVDIPSNNEGVQAFTF
jgi:hypothetical protein